MPPIGRFARSSRIKVKVAGYTPEEFESLPQMMAEQYVCNFSVFQSLIDHWACDQLFPIAPLHRLNESPDVDATLVDITCDSEGKVSKFTDVEDVRSTLRLHEFNAKQPYLSRHLFSGCVSGHHG